MFNMAKDKILQKLKADKVEFINKTHSFPVDLYERFVTKCQKEGVPMSAVIQELIREWLNKGK